MSEKWIEITVSDIEKAPWNYKTDDPVLQAKLVANLSKNGQIENLIVREIGKGKYEAVNGNHRLMALRELGAEKAMVFNLGKISDARAKQIAIETNETRFKADTRKLAGLIGEVIEEVSFEELSESMPYTQIELERMVDLIGMDWSQFEDGTVDIIQSDEKGGGTVLSLSSEQLKLILKMVKKELRDAGDGHPVTIRSVEKITLTAKQKKAFFSTIDKIRKEELCTEGKAIELICRAALKA